MLKRSTFALLALPALALSCNSLGGGAAKTRCPIAGGENADHLIEADEGHFARLWKLTSGGESAEGYWSYDDDQLVFQHRNKEDGVNCDRIYVTNKNSIGDPLEVSNGKGTTTCSFFLPGDREVVFASTQRHQEVCPPDPDRSKGYVWPLHPQFDLIVQDLNTGEERVLDDTWGYDAEAVVSPLGDRMVFTSTRTNDPELWTCDLDGKNKFQVTDELGYDGGAFFSHNGDWLVFRTTAFTAGNEAAEIEEYRRLFGQWLVKPSRMEIMVIRPDGTDRTQVTQLGGANFAPYFYPDDSRIMFSTNHHVEGGRSFDLFAVDTDGARLEKITTYEGFDCFPMFSRDGRFLAFASNRGGSKEGETNLFIAEWRD